MGKVGWALAMVAAVGCGGGKTTATATVGNGGADAGVVDAGGDAPADAPVGALDVSADVPEVAAESPFSIACKGFIAKIGSDLWPCGCKQADPPFAFSALGGLCAKSSDILGDASVAKEIAVDPAMEATCAADIAAFANGCDQRLMEKAFFDCTLAWFDTAKSGEDCHVGLELACDGGKGRCVVVQPPDGYKCFAAGGSGNACSTTQPCQVGLACLEGSLTRAKTCGIPGATCNLSDKCLHGFGCDNGVCKKDASLPDAMCKP